MVAKAVLRSKLKEDVAAMPGTFNPTALRTATARAEVEAAVRFMFPGQRLALVSLVGRTELR